MARFNDKLKLNIKEYVALSNYMLKKDIPDDFRDLIFEIIECFKINKEIPKDADRESDYKGTYNYKESANNLVNLDKLIYEKEKKVHDEFREKYLKLKNRLGAENIFITHSDITLTKSLYANYIYLEDLANNSLPNSVKKKLSPIITSREQVEKTVCDRIRKEFKYDNIKFQHYIKTNKGRYRIDCYFIDYKIAVEVDEWGHEGYYWDKERQSSIEETLQCKFIRFNPYSESINNLIECLKKTVENQKKKFQYTFSDDNLKKLDEIALISGYSIDEIIDTIIDTAYNEMIIEKKKALK